MLPVGRGDVAAAEALVALGYPEVIPVFRDMLLHLKVYDSSVADVFCPFFAAAGSLPLPKDAVLIVEVEKAIGGGKVDSGGTIRNRLLVDVLPHWAPGNIMPLKVALGCAATWPDAWDNDLLCIRLLFRHGLADITWLKQWLEFKAERQSARGRFLAEVRAELEGHVAPG